MLFRSRGHDRDGRLGVGALGVGEGALQGVDGRHRLDGKVDHHVAFRRVGRANDPRRDPDASEGGRAGRRGAPSRGADDVGRQADPGPQPNERDPGAEGVCGPRGASVGRGAVLCAASNVGRSLCSWSRAGGGLGVKTCRRNAVTLSACCSPGLVQPSKCNLLNPYK